MVIYDRFGNELPTEATFGIYLYQSTKAIRILFSNGLVRWIPQSMIDNIDMIDFTNHEELQYFEIARFLTIIHNLPIEY